MLWNENTCSNAAIHGHLEILKYAHEKGFPWDEFTCSGAASNGHLEILKYAHEMDANGLKILVQWLQEMVI